MKKTLFLALLLVLTCISYAQAQRTITGRVTNASTGEAIPFTTVLVQGTTIGTSADRTGHFSLTVPANATALLFSSVGYATLREAIGNRSVINAQLEPEAIEVGEQIVMGYGTARRVGTTVGSASVVKSDIFAARPSANVMDALQGQVAGLQILTSSGEPDALSSIRLHGIGSINTSNEPLILLDGSPITTGTLMAMNQNDIQSIVVLTDASATSIYGSRGANGVIFMMSKRGSRQGEGRPVVTLRTQYSLSNAARPKLKGMNTSQYANYLFDIEAANEADVEELIGLGDFNWFDAVFKKNAPMFQSDLSVNGATDRTSYFISSGYNKTEGVVPGSDMKRYSFRSVVDTKVQNWLKLGLSLGIGYTASSNAQTAGNSGTNWFTNPFNATILIPSFQTPYDEDGKPLQILDWTGGFASPLVMGELFPRKENRIQFNGNTFIEVTPVENLTLKSNLACNAFDHRRTIGSSPDYRWANGVGSVNERFQRNYTWSITNTAEYKWQMNDDHSFTALLGQESIFNDSELYSVRMTGIRDSRFMFLHLGTTLSSGFPTYEITQSTYNSVFGRVEYNYQSKYFADFSMRNDASSRFSRDNRNGLFYAVGAKWNAKQESFLANVDPIDALTLKASYGTSGNSSIGDYEQFSTLRVVKYNDQSGWAPDFPGNKKVGWEKQRLLTIGFSGGIYQKFRFNLEYYRRDTRDMLMNIPVSATSGFQSFTRNVGSMRNSGIDVTLDFDVFRNQDWSIILGTTFNYNRNKMLSLFDGLTQNPIDQTLYMVKGYPYPVFFMQEWRGVDPETGKPQWTDANGGITNNFDEAALVNLKKTWVPPYTGGLNFAVTWKDLTLSANVSWVAGKWMLNNTLYFSENIAFADGSVNQSTGALDYWKNPGDKAKYPSIDEQYAMGGTQFDSHMLENGSFIRLKNLQLSYNIPESILKGQKAISGIRVWVGARNLLTWTKYRGLDPEIDSDWSLDNYPNTRQVTFGLEMKF